MAKKEKNSSQAAQKVERKKLREQQKQAGERNRRNEVLMKDNRRLEQEFTELLAKDGAEKLLPSKLSQINDVRMKLGFLTKSMADYEKVILAAKKKRKLDSKRVELKQDDSSSDEECEQGYDVEDLSHIQMPKGIAPETEGQIYKSLSHLRSTKCSIYMAKMTAKRLGIPYASKAPASLFNIVPERPIITNLPIPTYIPVEIAASVPIVKKRVAFPKHSQLDPKSQQDPLGKMVEEIGNEREVRKAVFISAPVMRDLHKELTVMIPSSVKRKLN